VLELLNIQFSSGKRVRELVRHLRVYMRFERFETEKRDVTDTSAIFPIQNLFSHTQLKLEIYKTYAARLDALKSLPFNAHQIRLEICVFYNRAWYAGVEQTMRIKHNLFELVRPAYFRAKKDGADVRVHWENVETGARVDANELYDIDVLDSGEVSSDENNENTSKVRLMYSRPRKQPLITSPTTLQHPFRTAWTEAIKVWVESHEPHSSITWKHGLFDGPFKKCPCEPCRANAAPPCPGCRGEHLRGLHVHDDRGYSLPEDEVEQWRMIKEMLEMDKNEGIEVDEDTIRRVAMG
jgi:hypothetical protein